MSGLTFAYPDGRVALRDLALRVGTGERVALLGPNGAGKSTLLLALLGVIEARGEVQVFGERLTPATAPRIRARAGLVFANPDDQLFSPTVFDDVAFGPLHMGLPETEVRERAREALALVGLTGFEARVPHHLSTGERKRAALAAVLAMGPDALLLDEPSANLSPGARRDLVSLLERLPLTMLVATHDLDLARACCTRAVVLDRGRIVAEGTLAAATAALAAAEAAADGAADGG